ncbi:MAG: gamma-glutamylcyclotransferase family protein, partial [Micropepsaceae bacterium]
MSGHTFFFYGSLMDRELLEAVIGRDASNLQFAPGWLKGYVADTAERYSFPTLVEHRTGRVDGIVVKGLTAADIGRIAYFDDEDYTSTVAD